MLFSPLAAPVRGIEKPAATSISLPNRNFRIIATRHWMFQGQTVLITGAGGGIGAAAARQLADLGATVVVNDLDVDACKGTVASINAAGGQAFAAPGDVTDPKVPSQLLHDTLEQVEQLNILVNNAGFTWDGMLHKMSDDQWQHIQDLHTTAPFRLIRALGQVWRPLAKAECAANGPQPNRCIINVSSTSGLHGGVGQVNYATAKMGVIGMTKTVAREWGPLGIRCNAVAFGFIDTRLTRPVQEGNTQAVGERQVVLGIPDHIRQAAFAQIPMGRPGTAREAAAGIVLMASPWASYINGHTLEVTGGLGI